MLKIDSWGKKRGQLLQYSQFLRCFKFVFEMLWFLFEMLWMATMTLSSELLHLRHCHHQSMQALKLWGRKNCALLAVTPLRCITSDQFIRSTEIKWRFCTFHCMHFDTLGHSDTSMYLISVPKDGNLIDIKLALSSFIWYWNGAYFQKWILSSDFHYSFPRGKCC